MAKLSQIQYELENMATLARIVQAYENLASLQIRQIRDRVLRARQFFHELWSMYNQLRIDVPLQLPSKAKTGHCEVVITTDMSFSGGLDEQIVEAALEGIQERSTDIIAIGRRGAQLLRLRNIDLRKSYHLPSIETNIDIVPIMQLLDSYQKVTIYFARFESVTQQEVVMFELHESVARLQQHEQRNSGALLYASDFIFEPSLEEVVTYLESMMSSTALTEIILEANLSQLAFRYNSLSKARSATVEKSQRLKMELTRSQRRSRDMKILAYQHAKGARP